MATYTPLQVMKMAHLQRLGYTISEVARELAAATRNLVEMEDLQGDAPVYIPMLLYEQRRLLFQLRLHVTRMRRRLASLKRRYNADHFRWMGA